jgi:hypothetical protein
MKYLALTLCALAVGSAGADARQPAVQTGVIAGAPAAGHVPVLLGHSKLRSLSTRGLPADVRAGDRVRYRAGRLKIVRHSHVPSFKALAELLVGARAETAQAQTTLAQVPVPPGTIPPDQIPRLAGSMSAARTQINLLRDDLDQLALTLDSASSGIADQATRLRPRSARAAKGLDQLAAQLAAARDGARTASAALVPASTKLDEAVVIVNGTPTDALSAALAQFNLPLGVGTATQALQSVFALLNAISIPPVHPPVLGPS